uniref:Uncharacterized protein n=1 Tax=mine drainage metagenome TaxID=410659 RepID=E6QRH2_9ZZZZ
MDNLGEQLLLTQLTHSSHQTIQYYPHPNSYPDCTSIISSGMVPGLCRRCISPNGAEENWFPSARSLCHHR